MNFLELSLYIVTVIVMIATPGPVMILVASTGLKHGYRAALKTIFGTNIASLILIAFSILVLKGVLSINDLIFTSIKLLGSLYIAYLGYEILKEVCTPSDASPTTIKPVDGGFKKGFLVGISNPKDIIFFSSFFPQFINVHDNINISLSILVITWIILDFLTLSIVYVAFNALSQKSIYHKILGACGILLITIAIYGLITSIQTLLP
ncbi:LysE family translocator [Wohlfahrtiimonas larvae]|uniref:LysE family translocator n=1 Tax=Wohlfahrtiimonas larvae TaxID=1157986 RepID=A0ABP9MIL0_9GAMM|nr:LysE family translocator [Wohlfahrtiimonas larvae]